jgi:hypothetical protein
MKYQLGLLDNLEDLENMRSAAFIHFILEIHSTVGDIE